MILFWLIFGIISGGIIVCTAIKSKPVSAEKTDKLPDLQCNIILAILFALFSFVLFYKVTEIPVAYNVDEAGTAYDAISISKYHCDRYLYRFPVFFVNYGFHGQSALYTYLAAFAIKLFGANTLAVRLPAVVLSLFSALVFTLFMRKEYGNTASVITLALFCILPFSIMHSRWGLDCYLLFPMLIFSVVVFCITIQNGKPGWFFLSGCVFGVTLYSYSVSFMLIPLVLGVNLIYLLYIRKISWKHILMMAVPLFVFALPLMLMLAVNYKYLDEIQTPYFSIPQVVLYSTEVIHPENFINSLKFGDQNVFYNIFVDDRIVYNVNPVFGTIYYISLPFAVHGLILCVRNFIKAVRKKSYTADMMMLSIFLFSLLVSMTIKKTNINRSSTIFIPVIYFLVLSIHDVFQRKQASAYAAACLYLVYFLFFLQYYFTQFPADLKNNVLFSSVDDLREALLFAQTAKQDGEKIYIPDNSQPYIYTLLAMNIDPYTFNEQKVLDSYGYVKIVGDYRFNLDAILPGCVYVFRYPEYIPEDIDSYDMDKKQFGDIAVYYFSNINGDSAL